MLTPTERIALTEIRVTLDGKPAVILGARADFAPVSYVFKLYQELWATIYNLEV